MTAIPDIPEEFEPLFRSSPFVDIIGPLCSRERGADLIVGIRLRVSFNTLLESDSAGLPDSMFRRVESPQCCWVPELVG